MAQTETKHHDYHLVDPSPWPLVAAIGAFVMAVGAIGWMRSAAGEPLFGIKGPMLFAPGAMIIIASAFFWWRDVIANRIELRPIDLVFLDNGGQLIRGFRIPAWCEVFGLQNCKKHPAP